MNINETSEKCECPMLKYEVRELRTSLATVTEALILLQEFVEAEICEMSYLRDSGVHGKLVELFEKFRIKSSKPLPKLTPIPQNIRTGWNGGLVEKNSSGSSMETATIAQICNSDNGETDKAENSDGCTKGDIRIDKVFSIVQNKQAPLSMDKEQSSATTQNQVLLLKPSVLKKGLKKNSKFLGAGGAGTGNSNKKHTIVKAELKHRLVENGSRPLNKAKIAIGCNSKSSEKLTSQVRKRTVNRPVPCPKCHKRYTSRGVMARHLKEIHQKEPQFQCFYCPLKFRTSPSRLVHMNVTHQNEMTSLVCPHCKRESATPTGKGKHMMLCSLIHHGKTYNSTIEKK